MADGKNIFEVDGGSVRAEKITSGFFYCVAALDAAARDYDSFRARCILGKIQPPRREELEVTAKIMNYFAALMMSGHSLQFVTPSTEELAAMLRRTLFKDAQVSDAVLDDPGSV